MMRKAEAKGGSINALRSGCLAFKAAELCLQAQAQAVRVTGLE